MILSNRKRVLILCTGNSARSQMAEGLLRHDGGEFFAVESAGVEPSFLRPQAIAVMRELGLDISDHRSKSVDEFTGQEFDYVITVCDNANEHCPISQMVQGEFIGASTTQLRQEVSRSKLSTFAGLATNCGLDCVFLSRAKRTRPSFGARLNEKARP